MKTYAITGTFHGSIVQAPTEGAARKVFHGYYNGESITHVRCLTIMETIRLIEMI